VAKIDFAGGCPKSSARINDLAHAKSIQPRRRAIRGQQRVFQSAARTNLYQVVNNRWLAPVHIPRISTRRRTGYTPRPPRNLFGWRGLGSVNTAKVAELVDALDLGSSG
jgi:hypothetical protein